MIRINEQHLGNDATEAQARRMVELLRDEGYDVGYGEYDKTQGTIPYDLWYDCLDRIAIESQIGA